MRLRGFELQTHYRLLVTANETVRVDGGTPATVIITGRPYRVWLGTAVSSAGGAPKPVPNACLDAAGYWAGGAVSFAITP